MDEKTFEKNCKRLCSKFLCPESDLRDILLNCNGIYDYAFAYCMEMDIPQKEKRTGREKQHSYIPQENKEFIYGNPDIQQLHIFFPDMPLEQIAAIYWDSGNNLQKAANRILGKEEVYIQDEPKVELEYLQIKYSFIPSSEITAVFLRCQNNYTRTDRTIREEYDSTIRLHWNELQVFENRNGRYTHRSVVAEHKRLNTHYTSHTLEVEEPEEEEAPQHISHDQIEVLNQRYKAQQYLQTNNVLRLYRSEQARTNNKYLTGLTNAIQRNEVMYNQANRETGDMIFKAHNKQSLRTMIENGQPIDFHGLQVREVDEYMKTIMNYINQTKKRYRVTIITGSGNHSRNNISPVRNRVISLLQSNRVKFDVDGGKIVFSFSIV